MSCPKCNPASPAPKGRAPSSLRQRLRHPSLSVTREPATAVDVLEDEPGAVAGEPTILLVGNPNVGKSTVFNAVTNAHQRVINAPGTTVEVMAGRWDAVGARVLDLPGTYSLVATSRDEQVVVDTVAGAPGSFTDPQRGRSVDLVVVVLDATALTRSLYLLGQVARTGRPVAAVITLADVAEREAQPVDAATLSAALGIPVMAIDPRTSKGVEELDEMVAAALQTRPRVSGVDPDPLAPGYSPVAAAAAVRAGAATASSVASAPASSAPACPHCAPASASSAVPLMDEGAPAAQNTQSTPVTPPAPDSSAAAAAALESRERDPLADAEEIFAWVDHIEQTAIGTAAESARPSRSDRIDRLLLHPVIGIPVFFALMWLLFKVAGEWVGPVQDFFDGLFASEEPGAVSVAAAVNSALGAVGWEDTWLQGLLVGGLCTGLGVVASFLPLMFAIFLMISVLEDSGYMARAAFLGDRVMRAIGLDGRVIMPLIMGFGCNLPSLAATRTLRSDRQRLVTTLITPYTSCAARLTIYLMIARIFFPANTGTIVFGLYVLSLVMVVLGALVLKPFITKDEAQAPLMLVLPPYQMPRVLVMLRTTWLRSWAFVKGAGKIIVTMTLIVWIMGATPVVGGFTFAQTDLPMEDSLYGRTAQVLEPVFAPTGFGEWHLTGALMTGFVAKETVISSIVTSYNMDPETAGGDAEDGGSDLGSLPELVRGSFDESAGVTASGASAAPLAAVAFLVFVLAYTPCLATVAEQARQIGGRRAAAAVGVQLAVAWVVATAIFQIGRLVL